MLPNMERRELTDLREGSENNSGASQTVAAPNKQVEQLKIRLVAALHTVSSTESNTNSEIQWDQIYKPFTQRSWMMSSSVIYKGRGIWRIIQKFSKNLHHRILTTDIEEEEEGSDIGLDIHGGSPLVVPNDLILHHTGKQVQISGSTDNIG